MGVDCQPARKAMRIHWPLSDKEENNASHNGTKSIQIFFLYFIQMHFLFSPSIHLKSSRKTPNLTWNIGTTTISNGKRRPKREKRDSRGRERERERKYWPFFKVPHFHIFKFYLFVLVTAVWEWNGPINIQLIANLFFEKEIQPKINE